MTGPRPTARSIDDVAAPYGNFLVRVPAAGDDVCAVCRGYVNGYPRCYQCNRALQVLGGRTADSVAFVSLAPRGEQLAHELVRYKNDRLGSVHQAGMEIGLAAVLWMWLRHHEPCLTRRLNIDQFDVLTTVPSSTGRITHPLRRLAAGLVSGTADRHQDLLTFSPTDVAHRAHTTNRYQAVMGLRGARVLVIDDTWTTGAHAQSASAALKIAGAVAVAVVAIGRWVNPGYGDNKAWLAKHRKPGWKWTECCLEADTADSSLPAWP